MKKLKGILFFLLLIILVHTRCSKEPTRINLKEFEPGKCLNKNISSGVELYFALVNNENQLIDSFRLDENVAFKYYLFNGTDSTITYRGPCNELMSLLHVYKENSLEENRYTFIGQPSLQCVSMATFSKLSPYQTVEFKPIYLNSDINWPQMLPGSYFVGDSIVLLINDKNCVFSKRTYFKIY